MSCIKKRDKRGSLDIKKLLRGKEKSKKRHKIYPGQNFNTKDAKGKGRRGTARKITRRNVQATMKRGMKKKKKFSQLTFSQRKREKAGRSLIRNRGKREHRLMGEP